MHPRAGGKSISDVADRPLRELAAWLDVIQSFGERLNEHDGQKHS